MNWKLFGQCMLLITIGLPLMKLISHYSMKICSKCAVWFEHTWNFSKGDRINWIIYRFLAIFNEHFGKCYYECRHMHLGIIPTIFNCLGIITTYRLGDEYDYQCIFTNVWKFGSFKYKKNPRKFLKTLCTDSKSILEKHAKELMGDEWEHYCGVNEIFIPRYNVYCDWSSIYDA
ncbi:MAG: hypothetical protein M0R17_03540 [Candidatus Omnitrophica bacterium]|nr:hypothetical protein [Candidatus Omnitrophota bacterium]